MWEYKFVIISFRDGDAIDESESKLNTEGAGGWEVVAVLPKSAVLPKVAGADSIVLMKRAKAEASEQNIDIEPLTPLLDSLPPGTAAGIYEGDVKKG